MFCNIHLRNKSLFVPNRTLYLKPGWPLNSTTQFSTLISIAQSILESTLQAMNIRIPIILPAYLTSRQRNIRTRYIYLLEISNKISPYLVFYYEMRMIQMKYQIYNKIIRKWKQWKTFNLYWIPINILIPMVSSVIFKSKLQLNIASNILLCVLRSGSKSNEDIFKR